MMGFRLALPTFRLQLTVSRKGAKFSKGAIAAWRLPLRLCVKLPQRKLNAILFTHHPIPEFSRRDRRVSSAFYFQTTARDERVDISLNLIIRHVL
jgi:hypothetical protein